MGTWTSAAEGEPLNGCQSIPGLWPSAIVCVSFASCPRSKLFLANSVYEYTQVPAHDTRPYSASPGFPSQGTGGAHVPGTSSLPYVMRLHPLLCKEPKGIKGLAGWLAWGKDGETPRQAVMRCSHSYIRIASAAHPFRTVTKQYRLPFIVWAPRAFNTRYRLVVVTEQ